MKSTGRLEATVMRATHGDHTPADSGSSSGDIVLVVITVIVCLAVIIGSGYFIMNQLNPDERQVVQAKEGDAPRPPAGPGGPQAMAGPKVGEQAPDIAGEDLDGKAFKLS